MLAVVLASACSPATTRTTSGADRARAAKEATRALAAAEKTDLGCEHVVTSEERRATPAPEHLVLLTNAFAVAEPCWDRITFVFRPTGDDMPPGYEIEYQKGPFTEGDGSPVFVLGEAFLVVTFTPASQTDARDPGRPKQTYLGNLSLRLEDMHHTVHVRKLLDGEGTVTWIIGLDQRRPFTVDAANQPPRVNVYIVR